MRHISAASSCHHGNPRVSWDLRLACRLSRTLRRGRHMASRRYAHVDDRRCSRSSKRTFRSPDDHRKTSYYTNAEMAHFDLRNPHLSSLEKFAWYIWASWTALKMESEIDLRGHRARVRRQGASRWHSRLWGLDRIWNDQSGPSHPLEWLVVDQILNNS